MSNAKHTPGPWDVAASHSEVYSVDHGRLLNEVVAGDILIAALYEDEIGADSCLISAAPELLEALECLVNLDNNSGPFGGELHQDQVARAWDKAYAALAKARGEV